jgi:nucleosome binding factor SPN SPT16 subunit
VLISGSSDEDNPYRKTTALQVGLMKSTFVWALLMCMQTWLLGYEFPSLLLHLSPEKIQVVASSSKAKILQPLADSSKDRTTDSKQTDIELLVRTKDQEHNNTLWKRVGDAINGVGLFRFPC